MSDEVLRSRAEYTLVKSGQSKGAALVIKPCQCCRRLSLKFTIEKKRNVVVVMVSCRF